MLPCSVRLIRPMVSRLTSNQVFVPRRHFIKVIDQSTVAYREFLGGNRVKLEPGLVLNLPVLHNLHWVDMREGEIRIRDIVAYSSDATPILLSGCLFYKVNDANKACFNVQNYIQSTESVGTSAVRSIIGQFKWAEMNSKRNEINAKLVENLGKTLEEWGICCTKFEIQNILPQNEAVKRSLEQSIQAEQDKKKVDLETQAKVIVANGQKTIDIAISEGKTQAVKNQADGDYYEKVRRADSTKYEIDQTTIALKNQIEELTKAMVGNKELATQYLVEQQRLKHLQSLAKAGTNTVYFGNGNGDSLMPAIKMGVDMLSKSSH
jgi:regulator of protease activity HflC (stomatin/prohibitin superfamily)